MMLKTLGLLGWPVEGCSWACESMQIRSLSGAQFPSSKAASAVRILYAAQTDDMLDHIYFSSLHRCLYDGWLRGAGGYANQRKPNRKAAGYPLPSASPMSTFHGQLMVNMANDFNSVHRPAVFAAVRRATCMSPYVQWSYRAETNLHILLNRSISLCMAHLMRTTPWSRLEPSTR
jgi:hypothetical protein